MTSPLDIATLVADYAAGARTPEAVLDEICARIAAAARPVWITPVSADQVRTGLLAAVLRRDRGESVPLFGVPFAVKDNIDVGGLPTTAACPDFAYVPERSAAAVKRLEAAGAILVGKTNLDQFATGLVGTRSPYGACASAFSRDHVSGGSSSGSAVCVAEGLASFALGTDTAGSGRVPAAFNNIVGLKPTRGLVSARGVVPACRSIDCVSIFAGGVADASRVLDVIAGYDPADAFSRHAIPPARIGERFRFGVPTRLPVPFAASDGEAQWRDAVARMEAIGGTQVRCDLEPFLRAGALLYEGPFVAERLATLRAYGFERWDSMDPTVSAILRAGTGIDAADAFAGLHALAEATRETAAAWDDFDVLLLPTVARHPTLAEVSSDPFGANAALGTYTTFTNLLDLCAVAVPAGMHADGLPFGVTVMAPAWADAALSDIAARLHAALSDAKVGATAHAIGRSSPRKPSDGGVALAVVGAHLRGEPLNDELTSIGARLSRTTRTASGYRLFALGGDDTARPGLVRDDTAAGGIEVEVWHMPIVAFGAFVRTVPSPLCIGTLTLADGEPVKGFLCEPHATAGAADITGWGGWRAWRARAT